MIAATLAEQRKAKLKFFAAYIASVILIIIVFASLWREQPPAVINNVQAQAGEDKFVQADELLHAQMQPVDDAQQLLIGSNQKSSEGIRELQQADFVFKKTLDSLSKENASLSDEQQKQQINLLISSFRKTEESKMALSNAFEALVNDTARRQNNTSQNTAASEGEAMQGLKTMLVEKEQKITALQQQLQTNLAEKDKTIAALQNQLKQAQNVKQSIVVPQNTPVNDAELKQKMARLKAGYDNMAAQNATLNKSYKTLVEDNRRLLSQIQSMRRQ